MVVVIIIGILATLAYSNLMELVSINRAKETAQTMRTFTERALLDGKRLNKTVTIAINDKVIQYTPEGSNSVAASEPLGSGFSGNRANIPIPNCEKDAQQLVSFNKGAKSQLKIGISSIVIESEDNTIKTQGYFVACDSRGYCGTAVKVNSKNSLIACIKRPNNANWEAL